MSTEECGKAACNTDNPRELAQAIYNSIVNYSKMSFDASAIVMTAISQVISDFKNNDSDEESQI